MSAKKKTAAEGPTIRISLPCPTCAHPRSRDVTLGPSFRRVKLDEIASLLAGLGLSISMSLDPIRKARG